MYGFVSTDKTKQPRHVMCPWRRIICIILGNIAIFVHGLFVAFKPYYAVLNYFYAGMLKRYKTRLKTHPVQYYAKPGTHHMSWLLSFVCGYKTVHVYTLFSASEVNIKHACAVIMQAL